MQRTATPRYLLAGVVLAALCATGLALQGRLPRRQLGVQLDGTVLVPTNQTLSTIGVVRYCDGDRPKDCALSPDGQTLVVTTTRYVRLYGVIGTVIAQIPRTCGAVGVAWHPNGQSAFVTGPSGAVYRVSANDAGAWSASLAATVSDPSDRTGRRDPAATGLAISPDGRRMYVGLSKPNCVAVVEIATGKTTGTIPTGACPYRLLLSRDGSTLYTANRGGRVKRPGDNGTGDTAGTAIRIDRHTDAAAEGSVSVIDTRTWRSREVVVGRQPSGMDISADGRTLYVANSDSDTVSVVDTVRRKAIAAIPIRPVGDAGFGQMPTDVALSDDGATLYATCGGANAVAVIGLLPKPTIRGYVPTGWFPSSIAQYGGRLCVTNSKGQGARFTQTAGRYGVHGSRGSVQFLWPEVLTDLQAHTAKVAANNLWGQERRARRGLAAVPVPDRVGEPSVFRHVVYIIKENHTYDVTLGDMPEGNGDKRLTLFGEDVTPNQHALARQFVLLDNTYTSGTNSADGHQWTSSSICNAYGEQNYSANARSYPYDGGDALAYSPAGFLWNAAAKRGLSVRVYGEFVNRPKIDPPPGTKTSTWTDLWQDYKSGANRYSISAQTDNAALRRFLHPRFIGFPMKVSDQWRADQYLADLKLWERTGRMPRLSMLLLPNNHTSGTAQGMPTPRAAVADNDLALGRIVEAITKSRFWASTLIVVMEDDSQLGLDHVDGHRTLAFCVSPYTRRGAVVSRLYNHTSLVRTVELVLGIPAMNRFDRTATPFTACFTGTPNFAPYTALTSRVPLDELNPGPSALRGEARRLAFESGRQDFTDLDRADPDVVARAAWLSVRRTTAFPSESYHADTD